MAWASRAGHAITDPSHPQAQGVCDRCGRWDQYVRLLPQVEWQGPRLMTLNIIVCRSCFDKPYIFNRPIIVPPDPIPLRNPRPPQTDTGSVGWGMGGWSVGPYDEGQSPLLPAPVLIPAPPMTVSIDE